MFNVSTFLSHANLSWHRIEATRHILLKTSHRNRRVAMPTNRSTTMSRASLSNYRHGCKTEHVVAPAAWICAYRANVRWAISAIDVIIMFVQPQVCFRVCVGVCACGSEWGLLTSFFLPVWSCLPLSCAAKLKDDKLQVRRRRRRTVGVVVLVSTTKTKGAELAACSVKRTYLCIYMQIA